MKYIGEEYCDGKEIIYIENGDDGCYWINGNTGYLKKNWPLVDAVENYKWECEKEEMLLDETEEWSA